MPTLEIYSHPLNYRYKSSICAKATLYIFASIALTFVPPLLIAYRSQGFWLTTNVYQEQPDVTFKKQVMLILTTPQPGQFLAWSTYSNFNNQLQNNLRIPVITSVETDSNGDGKIDQLNFTASIPLDSTESITSFQLLLVFDYKLYKMSTFQMESLAYITYSSLSSGSSFKSFGDLQLYQKTLLRHRGVDTRFNTTIVDSTSLAASTYDLGNILKTYSERNITTVFPNEYPVWKSGRGATQPFTIEAIISYRIENIQYHPGFWEQLKWAWVQYVTILLLFLWVFEKLNIVVFSGHIFNTVVHGPKIKQQ